MTAAKKRAKGKRPGIRPKALGSVTVPDVPASELFAKLIDALGADSVNDGLRSWDFFADWIGRDLEYAGKTYEVVSWKKGRTGPKTGDELRGLFREMGYRGVVPAFFVWLIENRPLATLCETLPEEDEKCHYVYKGRTFVASPNHYRDGTGSRLYVTTPPQKLSPGEVFFAFRERSN